ncbi:hypothetical protein GCM10023321_48800 [Pseudonocardia eucalypti]|uniref:MCE family protein n=1 Tax=Pseudonocardia eucalypti TaxID=648755 RepID=A0ABP9QJ36_9PSEU|nr:phospholipid/cholesterol/gamma-HCH transport system substrate-binding protein [Pseudonocardia eucalypti]
MISSYIKRQLIVFSILTVAAVLIITFVYAKVPTALGFGRMTVTATFSQGAGIYPDANVTARGVGVGQIKKVTLTPEGHVRAVMSIDDHVKIGSDARAEIHSVSAVGEQYIDLITDQPGGPYLENGSDIPLSKTEVPEQIAPVLDKTTDLLASIPNDGLQTFLDEGYKAFHNLGPDLRTLIDSGQNLLDTADQNYAETSQLIRDIGPLLDTQNIAANSVRAYFDDLESTTGAVRSVNDDVRRVFTSVGHAATDAGDLVTDLDDPVAYLTPNVERVGTLLGIYRPNLEQILAVYPVVQSWLQVFTKSDQGRGLHAALQLSVTQGCTQGFNGENLRNPEDLSDKDAEPDTYCKVPHDDPKLVRGARNAPCMEGKKGQRSGTVLRCLGKDPRPDYGPGSHAATLAPHLPIPGTPAGETGPLSPPSNDNARQSPEDPLSTFGASGSTGSGKDETWQSLLTGPPGR